LLEAVELYFKGAPWNIFSVGSRREPDVVQRRKFDNFDLFNLEDSLRPLMNLFHVERGHILSPRILLTARHPEADFELQCERSIADILERESEFAQEGKLESSLRERHLHHLLKEGLVLTRGGKRSRPLMFAGYLRNPNIPGEMFKEEGWVHPDSTPVAFMPAQASSNTEAKKRWDDATRADKGDMIIEWLRFIEPKVRDLRYIGDPGSGTDLPNLKINGDRGWTPLSSMGDGLTRLFHIGLAMANASKGVLLIDEFENGLHWRVQHELWAALAKAAQEFDVQIFATTHSRDCIGGFVSASQELRLKDATLYRMEREGDEIYAVNLALINVEDALEVNGEVR